MTARTSAKLQLLDLVVTDRVRAEQVRRVYRQLVALGREYDLMRASSISKARAAWEKRTTAGESADPAGSEALELLLAPPLEQGKAAYERYTALMLEARSLLTQREFERLDRVR